MSGVNLMAFQKLFTRPAQFILLVKKVPPLAIDHYQMKFQVPIQFLIGFLLNLNYYFFLVFSLPVSGLFCLNHKQVSDSVLIMKRLSLFYKVDRHQ